MHNKDVIFAANAQAVDHQVRKFPQYANQRTDECCRTRQRNSGKSNPVPLSKPDRGDTDCFGDYSNDAACHYSLTGSIREA
jgi:hypothetical protein